VGVTAAPEAALIAAAAELWKALVEVLNGQRPCPKLSDSGRIREESAAWEGVQRGNAGRVAAFAVVVTDARDVEIEAGEDAIDEAALANS
jgi:hypothetical protein